MHVPIRSEYKAVEMLATVQTVSVASAITANAGQGGRENCLMDDYISKTVSGQELEAGLERWGAPQVSPAKSNEVWAASCGAQDINMLAELRNLLGQGGEAMVKEVVEVFLQDAPVRMEDARKALDQGDFENLMRAAHILKGSSSSLGAKRLAALCAELEKRAKRGSIEGSEEIMARLQTEFNKVCRSLESEWMQV